MCHARPRAWRFIALVLFSFAAVGRADTHGDKDRVDRKTYALPTGIVAEIQAILPKDRAVNVPKRMHDFARDIAVEMAFLEGISGKVQAKTDFAKVIPGLVTQLNDRYPTFFATNKGIQEAVRSLSDFANNPSVFHGIAQEIQGEMLGLYARAFAAAKDSVPVNTLSFQSLQIHELARLRGLVPPTSPNYYSLKAQLAVKGRLPKEGELPKLFTKLGSGQRLSTPEADRLKSWAFAEAQALMKSDPEKAHSIYRFGLLADEDATQHPLDIGPALESEAKLRMGLRFRFLIIPEKADRKLAKELMHKNVRVFNEWAKKASAPWNTLKELEDDFGPYFALHMRTSLADYAKNFPMPAPRREILRLLARDYLKEFDLALEAADGYQNALSLEALFLADRLNELASVKITRHFPTALERYFPLAGVVPPPEWRSYVSHHGGGGMSFSDRFRLTRWAREQAHLWQANAVMGPAFGLLYVHLDSDQDFETAGKLFRGDRYLVDSAIKEAAAPRGLMGTPPGGVVKLAPPPPPLKLKEKQTGHEPYEAKKKHYEAISDGFAFNADAVRKGLALIESADIAKHGGATKAAAVLTPLAGFLKKGSLADIRDSATLEQAKQQIRRHLLDAYSTSYEKLKEAGEGGAFDNVSDLIPTDALFYADKAAGKGFPRFDDRLTHLLERRGLKELAKTPLTAPAVRRSLLHKLRWSALPFDPAMAEATRLLHESTDEDGVALPLEHSPLVGEELRKRYSAIGDIRAAKTPICPTGDTAWYSLVKRLGKIDPKGNDLSVVGPKLIVLPKDGGTAAKHAALAENLEIVQETLLALEGVEDRKAAGWAKSGQLVKSYYELSVQYASAISNKMAWYVRTDLVKALEGQIKDITDWETGQVLALPPDALLLVDRHQRAQGKRPPSTYFMTQLLWGLKGSKAPESAELYASLSFYHRTGAFPTSKSSQPMIEGLVKVAGHCLEYADQCSPTLIDSIALFLSMMEDDFRGLRTNGKTEELESNLKDVNHQAYMLSCARRSLLSLAASEGGAPKITPKALPTVPKEKQPVLADLKLPLKEVEPPVKKVPEPPAPLVKVEIPKTSWKAPESYAKSTSPLVNAHSPFIKLVPGISQLQREEIQKANMAHLQQAFELLHDPELTADELRRVFGAFAEKHKIDLSDVDSLRHALLNERFTQIMAELPEVEEARVVLAITHIPFGPNAPKNKGLLLAQVLTQAASGKATDLNHARRWLGDLFRHDNLKDQPELRHLAALALVDMDRHGVGPLNGLYKDFDSAAKKETETLTAHPKRRELIQALEDFMASQGKRLDPLVRRWILNTDANTPVPDVYVGALLDLTKIMGKYVPKELADFVSPQDALGYIGGKNAFSTDPKGTHELLPKVWSLGILQRYFAWGGYSPEPTSPNTTTVRANQVIEILDSHKLNIGEMEGIFGAYLKQKTHLGIVDLHHAFGVRGHWQISGSDKERLEFDQPHPKSLLLLKRSLQEDRLDISKYFKRALTQAEKDLAQQLKNPEFKNNVEKTKGLLARLYWTKLRQDELVRASMIQVLRAFSENGTNPDGIASVLQQMFPVASEEPGKAIPELARIDTAARVLALYQQGKSLTKEEAINALKALSKGTDGIALPPEELERHASLYFAAKALSKDVLRTHYSTGFNGHLSFLLKKSFPTATPNDHTTFQQMAQFLRLADIFQARSPHEWQSSPDLRHYRDFHKARLDEADYYRELATSLNDPELAVIVQTGGHERRELRRVLGVLPSIHDAPNEQERLAAEEITKALVSMKGKDSPERRPDIKITPDFVDKSVRIEGVEEYIRGILKHKSSEARIRALSEPIKLEVSKPGDRLQPELTWRHSEQRYLASLRAAHEVLMGKLDVIRTGKGRDFRKVATIELTDDVFEALAVTRLISHIEEHLRRHLPEGVIPPRPPGAHQLMLTLFSELEKGHAKLYSDKLRLTAFDPVIKKNSTEDLPFLDYIEGFLDNDKFSRGEILRQSDLYPRIRIAYHRASPPVEEELDKLAAGKSGISGFMAITLAELSHHGYGKTLKLVPEEMPLAVANALEKLPPDVRKQFGERWKLVKKASAENIHQAVIKETLAFPSGGAAVLDELKKGGAIIGDLVSGLWNKAWGKTIGPGDFSALLKLAVNHQKEAGRLRQEASDIREAFYNEILDQHFKERAVPPVYLPNESKQKLLSYRPGQRKLILEHVQTRHGQMKALFKGADQLDAIAKAYSSSKATSSEAEKAVKMGAEILAPFEGHYKSKLSGDRWTLEGKSPAATQAAEMADTMRKLGTLIGENTREFLLAPDLSFALYDILENERTRKAYLNDLIDEAKDWENTSAVEFFERYEAFASNKSKAWSPKQMEELRGLLHKALRKADESKLKFKGYEKSPIRDDLAIMANVLEELGFLERAKSDPKFRADMHKIRSGAFGAAPGMRFDPKIVLNKLDEVKAAYDAACHEDHPPSDRCKALNRFMDRAAKAKHGVTSEARLFLLDRKHVPDQDLASLEYLERVLSHLGDPHSDNPEVHRALDMLRMVPHGRAINEQTKIFHPVLAALQTGQGQKDHIEKQIVEKLMKAAMTGNAVSRSITVSFDKDGAESFKVADPKVKACTEMKAKAVLETKDHTFDIIVGVGDPELLKDAETQLRRLATITATQKAAELLRKSQEDKAAPQINEDQLNELVERNEKTEFQRLYKEARRIAALRLWETERSPKLTLQETISRPHDRLGCALRALLAPDIEGRIHEHEARLGAKHITDFATHKDGADEYVKKGGKGVSDQVKLSHKWYHEPENAELRKIIGTTDPVVKQALEKEYVEKHIADYAGTGDYFVDYETQLSAYLGADHVAWEEPKERGYKKTKQQEEFESSDLSKSENPILAGSEARKKANENAPTLIKCVETRLKKGTAPEFKFQFPKNYTERNTELNKEMQALASMLLGQQRLLALASLEHGKAGGYAEERSLLKGQREQLESIKKKASERKDAASVESQEQIKEIEGELQDVIGKIKDTARHEFSAKVTLEALLKRPVFGELSKEEEHANNLASEKLVALVQKKLIELQPKDAKKDDKQKLGLLTQPFPDADFLEKLVANPEVGKIVGPLMKARIDRAKAYYKELALPEHGPLPHGVTEAAMIERLSHLRVRSLLTDVLETMRKTRIEREFRDLSQTLEKDLGQKDQEHFESFKALAKACMAEVNRVYDPEVKSSEKHVFRNLDDAKNGEVAEVARLLYNHMAQRKAVEHLAASLQPPPGIGLSDKGLETVKTGPWSSYKAASEDPATKHAVDHLKKLIAGAEDSLKMTPADIDRIFAHAFQDAAAAHQKAGSSHKNTSVGELKELTERLATLNIRWNGVALDFGKDLKGKESDLALWKMALATKDHTSPYHVKEDGKFSWSKSLQKLRDDMRTLGRYGRYIATGTDPWQELMTKLNQSYTKHGFASRFEFGDSLVIMKDANGKEVDPASILKGASVLDFLTDPQNSVRYLEFLNLDQERHLGQIEADDFRSKMDAFKFAGNNYRGAANRLFGWFSRTWDSTWGNDGPDTLTGRRAAYDAAYKALEESVAKLKSRGAVTVHTSLNGDYGPISAYRLARSFELERAHVAAPEFEKTLHLATKSIEANDQFWAETAAWEAATIPLHFASLGLSKLATTAAWSVRAVRLASFGARVLGQVKHGIHIADAFSIFGTLAPDLVNRYYAPPGHYEVNSDQAALLKSSRESRYIFIAMPFVQQSLGVFLGRFLPAAWVPWIAEPLGLYASSRLVHEYIGGQPGEIAHRQAEHSFFIGFPFARLFGVGFARWSFLRNHPNWQGVIAGVLTLGVFAGHDLYTAFTEYANEGVFIDPTTGKELTGVEARNAILRTSLSRGLVPNLYFAYQGGKHAKANTARALLAMGESPTEVKRLYGEHAFRQGLEAFSVGEIREISRNSAHGPLLDAISNEHGFESRTQFLDYLNKEVTKIGKGFLHIELGLNTHIGEAANFAARQAREDLIKRKAPAGEQGFRDLANHSLFTRTDANGDRTFRAEALPQISDRLTLDGLRSNDAPTRELAAQAIRGWASLAGISPANVIRFADFINHYTLNPGESIYQAARSFRWLTPARVRHLFNTGRLSLRGLVEGFPSAEEAAALNMRGFTRDRALSAFTDAELLQFFIHASNPTHAQRAEYGELVNAFVSMQPFNATSARMWRQIILREPARMTEFLQLRGRDAAAHPDLYSHIPLNGLDMNNAAHAGFVNSTAWSFVVAPVRPLAAFQARLRDVIRNNPTLPSLRAAIDLTISQSP